MTKKEQREKPVSTEKQNTPKSERQKAKESLDFWLAKIETRALIALAKGKKDV